MKELQNIVQAGRKSESLLKDKKWQFENESEKKYAQQLAAYGRFIESYLNDTVIGFVVGNPLEFDVQKRVTSLARQLLGTPEERLAAQNELVKIGKKDPAALKAYLEDSPLLKKLAKGLDRQSEQKYMFSIGLILRRIDE